MNNSVKYWAQLSLLDKRIDFNQVGAIVQANKPLSPVKV